MRRKAIIAIDLDKLNRIVDALEDIYEVDSGDYTEPQKAAFDEFWEIINRLYGPPKNEFVGVTVDVPLLEYQRLTLAFMNMVIPEDTEVLDGIQGFLDAMSDTFWPEVTDDLDEDVPYTEQLKKIIDL